MHIGLPSAGKSPAIDAALTPLRKVEKGHRQEVEQELAQWSEQAEVAKMHEAAWKEAVKVALKKGKAPPERPAEANAGEEPHIPRYVVNDGTIERLAAIVSKQPRGALQMRDELAGWLEGMDRYSGSSDRPFWLEAFGGRGFTVERMGRPPVSIDRLSIAVLGGIQPDRLKTLLFKSDDDGLLARFLPCWPEPAPIKRPQAMADEGFITDTIKRLLALQMATDEAGGTRPWLIPFTEDSRNLMDEFRLAVRAWEGEAEGLLLSFIGKLPGLTARLALVIACLDHAAEGEDEPHEIDVSHFGRAAHMVEAYLLPMAWRAYASASVPKAERAARRLIACIRDRGWREFATPEVLKLTMAGLHPAKELDPVLEMLVDTDCIRPVTDEGPPRRGRPRRAYQVNPKLLEGQK